MKKIFLILSTFLFFATVLFNFSSPVYSQNITQTCKIQVPEIATFGIPYTISITDIDETKQDIPAIPLSFEGIDVALPDGKLRFEGNTNNIYSFTTELNPGTYKIVAYKSQYPLYWNCNSILTVVDNPNPDAPKPTILPTVPASSNGTGYRFESPQDPTTIDGYTPSISLIFDGLISNTDYEVCFESDASTCEIGGKKKGRNMETNGQITLKNICGDGPSAVKQKDECDKTKDYFHEGSTYAIHLFEKGTSSPLISAPFYVKHTYPNISISDNVNISVDTSSNPYRILINNKGISEISSDKDYKSSLGLLIKNPLNISLSQIIKIGGEKKNNFQIVLEGVDNRYKSEICKSLAGARGETGILSTYFNGDPLKHDTSLNYLVPGKYLLKINERINDSSTWRHTDDCQGGFTYYHIPITTLFEDDKETGRRILNTYIDINNIKADPNESENFYSDSEENKFGSLPCIEGKTADGDIVRLDPTRNRYENIVECTQYATAIGSFGTDPLGFISTLGTWLFRIATISTFALMIYAGILFQISRGDKEKIGKAREIITAAITGLIFLILSVSILQIIGIDILKIPGFVREDTVATPTPAPTLPPGRPADRGR